MRKAGFQKKYRDSKCYQHSKESFKLRIFISTSKILTKQQERIIKKISNRARVNKRT